MPDVTLGSQIFDLAFHPREEVIYTGLLSGQVTALSYNSDGETSTSFSLGLSKKSIRGISLNTDGSCLYAAGKGKAICMVDTATGKLTESRTKAHETSINRIKYLAPWSFATGDDDGVIKLWDPRTTECVTTYKHHFDYITDFLWLGDTKQIVATSGDGSLSVLDARSKKSQPVAQSEDQEDELLSLVAIKGGSKILVGTQIGILSVFNRKSGWGDCVDRLPGHPQSIDTLCSLPDDFPWADTTSTIFSGSSDGLVRAVNVFPTSLLGVAADHDEWPVERIAVAPTSCKDGERWWLGSVGHDEKLKLTDLKEFFSRSGKGEDGSSDNEDGDDSDAEATEEPAEKEEENAEASSSEDETPPPPPKKRKKIQKEQDAVPRKKGKKHVDIEPQFFDEL